MTMRERRRGCTFAGDAVSARACCWLYRLRSGAGRRAGRLGAPGDRVSSLAQPVVRPSASRRRSAGGVSAVVAVRRRWPFGAVARRPVVGGAGAGSARWPADAARRRRAAGPDAGVLRGWCVPRRAAGMVALGIALAGGGLLSSVRRGRSRICFSGPSSSRGCRGRWGGSLRERERPRAGGSRASRATGRRARATCASRRSAGSERGSRASCTT